MNSVRWWSQPFAPEGSATAEGIARQLGKPALDPLEILVREAAQNSWDARSCESGGVNFRIGVERLGSRSPAWRSVLLPGPDPRSLPRLDAGLADEAWLMVVSDRGTSGLGGPVRAHLIPERGERGDFVQFLRNVGEPRDNELGGGTYGFGKGIFYRLSGTASIVVDTRIADGGRRLMAASLGGSFVGSDGYRYTGRHWFGQYDEAARIVDPVTGQQADALSTVLGLPGFLGNETGTDIAIIGAEFGEIDEGGVLRARTPREVGVHLASAILWNLWPKMVDLGHGCPMNFEVVVDGQAVELPPVDSISDLAPFVAAYRELHSGGGSEFARKSAPRSVGRLSVKRSPAMSTPSSPIVNAAKPFDGDAHHIARMRQVDLVVDYYAGPISPNSSVQYGGVFRASQEVDEMFAGAEPPTHDSWIERDLRGTSFGVVRGARLFIRNYLDAEFYPSVRADQATPAGLSLLSSRLGTLLGATRQAALESGPSDKTPSQPRAPGGRSRTRITSEAPRVYLGPDGAPYIAARVRLPERSEPTTYVGAATVVLDGGTLEASAPIGAQVPRVFQWFAVDESQRVGSDRVDLAAGPAEEWWVYCTHTPDAVVQIEFSSEVSRG